MTRKLFFLSAVVLAYLLVRNWEQRPVEQPPGVLVASVPVQDDVQRSSFRAGKFTLYPRARFEIEARVLSTRRYHFGRGASLAPVDLALGWGPMSDSSLLAHLDISQSARWYSFRYDAAAPVDGMQIARSSANMHMVPAGRSQEKQLKSLRVGEIVKIRGLLIDVSDDSGWSWSTSLSRDDTGAGACEIVYVESIHLVSGPTGT